MIGLKLHEDWGTTPLVISHCLDVAETHDVQVAIHSDILNESGFVEDTIAAAKKAGVGCSLCAFHTKGAGGGHAPAILPVVGKANFLPSLTNPTMPCTLNTLIEHVDMLMVWHQLDSAIAHGISHEVGSIEAGNLADLVVWKPAFFGIKPSIVFKSGFIALAALSNPNASIPTPQPVPLSADVQRIW